MEFTLFGDGSVNYTVYSHSIHVADVPKYGTNPTFKSNLNQYIGIVRVGEENEQKVSHCRSEISGQCLGDAEST